MKVWLEENERIGGEALLKVHLEKKITTSLLVAGELSVSVFAFLSAYLYVCLSVSSYPPIYLTIYLAISFKLPPTDTEKQGKQLEEKDM